MRPTISLLLAAVVSTAAPADAFEPLDGWLHATRACPASRSLRGATDAMLVPGRAYRLLGQNRARGTHYRVALEIGDRWVAVSCGSQVPPADAPAATPAPASPPEAGDAGTGGGPDYVLALTWQPAFCESAVGLGTPECATQTVGRHDGSHLSLHGLWPQPRDRIHCRATAADIANDRSRATWSRLPAVALSPETRRALERVMPGTMSGLDRHQWIKHGTCHAETPEPYFAAAVMLVDQVNASPVRTLFADNIGRDVDAARIRAAFDGAFGAGAGDRVEIRCLRDGTRRLILSLRLGLAGEITGRSRLGDLMRAAPPRPRGCRSGTVDPVGLQ